MYFPPKCNVPVERGMSPWAAAGCGIGGGSCRMKSSECFVICENMFPYSPGLPVLSCVSQFTSDKDISLCLVFYNNVFYISSHAVVVSPSLHVAFGVTSSI